MDLPTQNHVMIQMPSPTTNSYDTIMKKSTIMTKSNSVLYLLLIGILFTILISISIFMVILASMDEIGDEFVWSLWFELCILFAFIASVLGFIWYIFQNRQKEQSIENQYGISLACIAQLVAIVIIFAVFRVMDIILCVTMYQNLQTMQLICFNNDIMT